MAIASLAGETLDVTYDYERECEHGGLTVPDTKQE